MKQFSWDEYYERFSDWSFSTQKKYSYGLSDFGPADEVFELVIELASNDEKFGTRFVEKALAAGVRFTPEQVIEMTHLFDEPTLGKMAEQTSLPFSKEQLEDIYPLIDEASFERISKRQNVDIFTEDESEVRDYSEDEHEFAGHEPRKPGFFSALLAVFAGFSMGGHSKKRRHDGLCDGDCANCPPHYGYRYGRWYYGHEHVHGCEFGGNGGSGSGGN